MRWSMSLEARLLLFVTAILLAFGLATLFSASAIVALQAGKPGSYYASRQAIGALVGVVLFMIAAKVDAQRLEKLAWPMMIAALVAMGATLIGSNIHGSRRFLLGGSIQPAEFAKIAIVVWTSMMVLKRGEHMRRLSKGMPAFLLWVGALALIAFIQPDLSMALLFLLLMGLVLFAGGVRIGHFIVMISLAAPLAWHQVQRRPYVLNRISSWMSDSTAVTDLSRQQFQSLVAVGSGGLTGRGFGDGRQQYGWVPMGIDDFVASSIGEEWGFLGFGLVVIGFAVWTALGFRIARKARTPFLQLVAFGFTCMVSLTAYVHFAVVINLLPNTGLTLPFFSNGRSNLVLTLLVTGILVNIGSLREAARDEESSSPDPLVPT